MKYIAVTYGTEGDARPLAALCRALMDAGHEAILLADAATLGSAHALGVPATALAGDIKDALRPGAGISGVVAGGNGFTATATAKALARIANANTGAWLRTTMDAAATGAGCDAVIVSGLAAFVGLSAAERLGVKAIGTGLIPITPTAAFASPFLPPAYVPRMLNRASHRFVNAMLWRAFRKATNQARERVCGLAPRGSVWTDHPMLYGVSPALLPRPDDWPADAHVCGQWSAAAPEWSPPQALREFLDAGEAPVYVGFGSMVGFDRERLPAVIAEAVAGRRTLFNPGWSGVDTRGLPDNLFVVGEAPHAWLFPRTSLVVHHGGSGTTHSAARAGVPSVVVPFAGDQPFWAARLREAGVAGDPVEGTSLRSTALARGIEFAERADVRMRARALGEAMAEEDGLAAAVPLIEALTSRRR